MTFDALPKLYPAMPDDALAGSATSGNGATGAPSADFASVLGAALSGASDALVRADAAEHAFVSGRGGLQAMVLERAQADVALSIASAAATRTTQAISTILAMQI